MKQNHQHDSSVADGIKERAVYKEETKYVLQSSMLTLETLKHNQPSVNNGQKYNLNTNTLDDDETKVRPGLKMFMKSSTMINPHNFEIIIKPSACKNSHVFIVIFVHSAPEHFAHRKTIRETWASVTEIHGKFIETVFLLGQTKDVSLQNAIEREAKICKDIVQENFIDAYRNLTYKHVMGLKWVSEYCNKAKFVVKLDDDVFVNVFKLVLVLENPRKLGRHVLPNNTIYCSTNVNASRQNDPDHKHYVTSGEYPVITYPTYCNGYFYIITPEIATKLYQLSLRTRFFWIDDVYVTGILAENLNITRAKLSLYNGYQQLSHLTRVYGNPLLIYNDLGGNVEDIWRRFWKRILRFNNGKILTVHSNIHL